jgi:hypothetical protein
MVTRMRSSATDVMVRIKLRFDSNGASSLNMVGSFIFRDEMQKVTHLRVA